MRSLIVACSFLLGSASVAPVLAADKPSLPIAIVDALNAAFGKHPGYRANHAKGVVFAGTFTGDKAAAQYSTSPLFSGETIPVIVRFSDSTGLPELPDGSPDANPHGIAIRYQLPAGGQADMVLNSLRFFPVRTGEEFVQLLQASVAPPEPHPNALEQFMAAHPQAPKAFASAQTPDSFAHQTYWGVDSFWFINAQGQRQAVRYVIRPAEEKLLSPEEAKDKPRDFLIDDIRDRVSKGKVTFTVKAQLAEPGDPVLDATQPWPDSRKEITLGTLTVDKTAPENAPFLKTLLFIPTKVTAGIEASQDPILQIRSPSYGVSFSRRIQ